MAGDRLERLLSRIGRYGIFFSDIFKLLEIFVLYMYQRLRESARNTVLDLINA